MFSRYIQEHVGAFGKDGDPALAGRGAARRVEEITDDMTHF